MSITAKPPIAYKEPRVSAQLMQQLDLGLFDFILKRFKTPRLRADQVAELLGYSRQKVYEWDEEGRLESFSPPGVTVERKLYTLRSATLLLLSMANFEPKDFGPAIATVFKTLSRQQLIEARAALDVEIRNRPL